MSYDDPYTEWSAEALEQLAGDLDIAHKAIVAELDDLETKVEKHLNQWTGEARNAYTDAKREWNKLQAQQNDISQKFQGVVRDIHQKYGDTERKNASAFPV